MGHQLSVEELDKIFKEQIKHEVDFCDNVLEARKNEYGVHIYKSVDGASSINLPCVLQHYKEWLIEQGLVVERI
jgi:hypothetical protein